MGNKESLKKRLELRKYCPNCESIQEFEIILKHSTDPRICDGMDMFYRCIKCKFEKSVIVR